MKTYRLPKLVQSNSKHVWYRVHQVEGNAWSTYIRKPFVVNRTVSLCAGCRPGLQRDPLPREADHPDGQTQEVLQREGWCPRHLPQVRKLFCFVPSYFNSLNFEGSCLTVAASMTTRLRKLWRWSRTTSLRSTRNRLEDLFRNLQLHLEERSISYKLVNSVLIRFFLSFLIICVVFYP